MPNIQKDDIIEIASDPRATADVLPITITRSQEVTVWSGSLKEADDTIVMIQGKIDNMQNLSLPELQQNLVDAIAFKANLQTEFDKQKPVSSDTV